MSREGRRHCPGVGSAALSWRWVGGTVLVLVASVSEAGNPFELQASQSLDKLSNRLDTSHRLLVFRNGEGRTPEQCLMPKLTPRWLNRHPIGQTSSPGSRQHPEGLDNTPEVAGILKKPPRSGGTPRQRRPPALRTRRCPRKLDKHPEDWSCRWVLRERWVLDRERIL